MKFKNDFYANEHEIASKQYLNAIGDNFEAIGDSFEAQGNGGAMNVWNADAGVGAKPASLPYIVTLTNSTTANITNVPIFNSNVYARNAAGLPAGVVYTVQNYTSYDALLMQAMYKKFLVGRTYWIGSSAAQASITFTVINNDADGRTQTTPIIPVLEKTSFQNTVNDNNTRYIIDGNTEVRLSTLFASSNITIYFYPAETVNDKKELSGQGSTTQYSSPY